MSLREWTNTNLTAERISKIPISQLESCMKSIQARLGYYFSTNDIYERHMLFYKDDYENLPEDNDYFWTLKYASIYLDRLKKELQKREFQPE